MLNSVKMIVVVLVMCLVFLAGCEDKIDRQNRRLVNNQQEHYAKVHPIPFYEYSLELDAYIQIYDARIKDVVRTWTVWRSDHGMILGHCESIGFPIPYDVQMTNPVKKLSNHDAVVEQAEPSGLYSSKNSNATWVRAVVNINGNVVITPIYVEDNVTCYPYPIKVDYSTNRVTPVLNALPTVIIQNNLK